MGHTVCARSWCSGTIVGTLKLNISGHSSDWSKLLNFPVGFQVSALSDRAARQPHCWQLLRHICGWMDQLNTGWNPVFMKVHERVHERTPLSAYLAKGEEELHKWSVSIHEPQAGLNLTTFFSHVNCQSPFASWQVVLTYYLEHFCGKKQSGKKLFG